MGVKAKKNVEEQTKSRIIRDPTDKTIWVFVKKAHALRKGKSEKEFTPEDVREIEGKFQAAAKKFKKSEPQVYDLTPFFTEDELRIVKKKNPHILVMNPRKEISSDLLIKLAKAGFAVEHFIGPKGDDVYRLSSGGHEIIKLNPSQKTLWFPADFNVKDKNHNALIADLALELGCIELG